MAKNQAKAAKSLKIPKAIRMTGRFLEWVSPELAARFAARLFTTPLKHRMPRREAGLDQQAAHTKMSVPAIGKDIVVYRWGNGDKKILLVHGWSGRGTQLVKFADALIAEGFEVVSFDAPAHGKSPGRTTLMPEFIAAAFEIRKALGPFHAVVGHSLGGMAMLNAIARGFDARRLVTIGSGDVIQDIIDEFVARMELKKSTGDAMRRLFEKRRGEAMDGYSSYRSARKIGIPVLVIHDADDYEVPVECARHIAENLQNGKLVLTHGLGHRKILGSREVVNITLDFIR